MNKKLLITFSCFAAFACIFGLSRYSNLSEAKADSVNDYLNPANWRNLPGYEYKAPGIRTDEGQKLPAEVTFPADENDVGINFKMKGYYASGTGDQEGNMYAGLIYKNKMKLEDLDVTFTINSLGANSAVGDDGWVSICFLEKENMFSTTTPSINMGSVALLRTQTRSITVYDHEIGEDQYGTKYANFATGSNCCLDLDVYPACEGCTLRVYYEHEVTAAYEKFYLVIEQLDFETGEIISTKKTANPLIHSDDYAAEGKEGYFVISTSTDNYEKQWDISIKNICGVNIGTKSDVKPLSPQEKAEKTIEYINALQISTYCNLDGSIKEDGKTFYSPLNDKVDVNNLATQLSSSLYTFNSEDIQALADISREASAFPSAEAYKEYLDTCTANIIDNYDTVGADILIANIEAAVAKLPPIDQVSLKNEQEVGSIISALQVYYEMMNDKVTEKYGKEKKEKLWNDIIVKYSDKLDDIKFDKLESCVEALPETVTNENLKDSIFNLVPAEMMIEYFDEKIDDVRERKPEMYASLLFDKEAVGNIRSQVDTFKVSQRALVEDLETAARVNYNIYYLSDEIANDLDSVFEVLTQYASLSSSVRQYVDSADRLFSACAKALDAAIVKLPSLDELRKEDYIQKGYDVAINNVYQKFIQLKNVSPTSISQVTNSAKLLALVDKLDKITNPLSAKTVMDQTLDVSAKLEMTFVDMFNNYDGRNYTVTANYGTVDMAGEKVVITMKENGTYTVSVTMTDTDYGDVVTCSFKLTVSGAKSGGCGGAIVASGAASIIALLGVCVLIFRKKER